MQCKQNYDEIFLNLINGENFFSNFSDQSNSNYGYGWENDAPPKSEYTSSKNFKFGEKSIRLGFIRKVYTILSVSKVHVIV